MNLKEKKMFSIVESDTCGFRILLTVLSVSARCGSKVQGQQGDHYTSRLSEEKIVPIFPLTYVFRAFSLG